MRRQVARFIRMVLTVASFAAVTSVAIPAHGQPFCGPREQVADLLRMRFGETVSAFGVDQNGRLVQVFTSPVGSWTIVVTIPGGPTCLVSAGDGWRTVPTPETPAESHGS